MFPPLLQVMFFPQNFNHSAKFCKKKTWNFEEKAWNFFFLAMSHSVRHQATMFPPGGGGKLEKIEIWQILQGQSKHCIVLLFTTLQLFLCFKNYYCHWILDKLA